MLTLFHSPNSCSMGILVLLHEVGADFTAEIVNVRERQQFAPEYLARNPKHKVPALLLDDGSVLTEFQTIAFWIANKFPKAGLWPRDLMAQTRTLEALDYMVGSVHMRGLTFVKMPQKFHEVAASQASIQQFGRSEVDKGLKILSDMLGEKDYICGEFGIADCALFYILTWSEAEQFDLPDNLAACLARLRGRESVVRALA